MDHLTSEQQTLHTEICKVKDRIADEFLTRPGITGIGVGFKYTGGERTDQLAIRFYVKRKKAVSTGELIPSTIHGIPADVIEADMSLVHPDRSSEPTSGELPAKGMPKEDPARYDPLVGGISLSPFRLANAGTLGLIVKEIATGLPLMLSCYHVMCGKDRGFYRGDLLSQPGTLDDPAPHDFNACGELRKWFVGDISVGDRLYGVDCAVAMVDPSRRKVQPNQIQDIGPVTGYARGKLGDQCRKRGRTTTVTQGVIDDDALIFSVLMGPPYGHIELHNMLRVIPTNDEPGPFCEYGDSGSVLIWTDQGQSTVCGMLVGAGGPADAAWGIASQIEPVLKVLSIEI